MFSCVKDTHRENAISYKTQALTKSINMDTWTIDTLDQLILRGPCTKYQFSRNGVFSCKSPFFVMDPLCTPYSICVNIGFWQGSSVCKCCDFRTIKL